MDSAEGIPSSPAVACDAEQGWERKGRALPVDLVLSEDLQCYLVVFEEAFPALGVGLIVWLASAKEYQWPPQSAMELLFNLYCTCLCTTLRPHLSPFDNGPGRSRHEGLSLPQ